MNNRILNSQILSPAANLSASCSLRVLSSLFTSPIKSDKTDVSFDLRINYINFTSRVWPIGNHKQLLHIQRNDHFCFLRRWQYVSLCSRA